MFKLILLRPESFFNFQDELKEETSVDTDREKPNFHRNIDEKWVSTILTNPFDKNFPLFLHGHCFARYPLSLGMIGPELSPLLPAGRRTLEMRIIEDRSMESCC